MSDDLGLYFKRGHDKDIEILLLRLHKIDLVLKCSYKLKVMKGKYKIFPSSLPETFNVLVHKTRLEAEWTLYTILVVEERGNREVLFLKDG